MNTRPQERLPAAVSFAAAALTSAVVAGLVLGWGAGLALGVVGLVSLVAGVRGPALPRPPLLSPYVLVIVVKLVDDCVRYALGFTPALGGALPWQGGSGPLSLQVWFVGAVVLPVVVMLSGGYLLGRGHPAGVFLAWWAPLVAVADGLWGLSLGPALDWGSPGPAVAVLTSALAEVLVAVWALQVLLRRSSPGPAGPGVLAGLREPAVLRGAAGGRPPAGPRRGTAEGLTPHQRSLWTVLFVALTSVYGGSLFLQAGPLPVVVIAGSMVAGLVGWRTTTAHHPADPAYHVPLYLLLLALFYLHVGEESLTGFNRSIAAISGTPWQDGPFTLVIGLLGPAVWVFGAWSLWHRRPFGNFVLWFMIVGMILGEPTHLVVFPVMVMWQTGSGYEYFSGMYTALFPMVPAVLALAQILRAHRARGRDTATVHAQLNRGRR